MQNDLIIINDYCTHCNIEPDFVLMLGEGGLIDIEVIDDTSYFPASQLNELEKIYSPVLRLVHQYRRDRCHPSLAGKNRKLANRVKTLENELRFYRR